MFLSPPWGGPQYLDAPKFNIASMMKPNGYYSYHCSRLLSVHAYAIARTPQRGIFKAALQVTPNIAYFVPRNVNYKQMRRLATWGGDPAAFVFDRNAVDGKVKAITAYYGELAYAHPLLAGDDTAAPASDDDGAAAAAADDADG